MAAAVEQVCLPIPLEWTVSGPRRVLGSTVCHWEDQTCSRVLAYADLFLKDLSLGTLLFDIEKVDRDVPQLGIDESYEIQSTDTGLKVSAPSTWGGLRAVATLYQLALQSESGGEDEEQNASALGGLPTEIHVIDRPRFPWRGVLIDVARHFMPIELLQRVIDGLAMLKLNVLHLHLTDDQGFRFESKCHPNLASEEHYSQAELQSLVEYAANVGVRLVPELDMPGHVTSWLTAYPEWGRQDVVATVKFGVHGACLDVINPDVVKAIDELLEEVTTVFPDQHLHIGGDEVHPGWWREDDRIAAHMRNAGMSEVAQVQNEFNRTLVALLKTKDRQVVGWDEVLHEDMPEMLVQNWRGSTTRNRALNKNLNCIVSAPYYLDLHYPADMHYAYDPQADQADAMALEDEQQKDLRLAHVADGIEWTKQWRREAEQALTGAGVVLGGEACLWSELVDANVLEVRLWSRLPAVAETLWSFAERKDVDSLYCRMECVINNRPFGVASKEAAALERLGFTGTEAEVLRLLEPVKWYGRLLGETALLARLAGEEMPKARPYDTTTPLDRVIDAISPESLSARRLRDLTWSGWIEQAQGWAVIDLQVYPEEVKAAIEALTKLSELVLAHDSDPTALDLDEVLECYGPHGGEYMLAVVPALTHWLANQSSEVAS